MSDRANVVLRRHTAEVVLDDGAASFSGVSRISVIAGAAKLRVVFLKMTTAIWAGALAYALGFISHGIVDSQLIGRSPSIAASPLQAAPAGALWRSGVDVALLLAGFAFVFFVVTYLWRLSASYESMWRRVPLRAASLVLIAEIFLVTRHVLPWGN